MLGKRSRTTSDDEQQPDRSKRLRIYRMSYYETMERTHYFYLIKRYAHALHFPTGLDRHNDYAFLTRFIDKHYTDEQAVNGLVCFQERMMSRLQATVGLSHEITGRKVARVHLMATRPPVLAVMFTNCFPAPYHRNFAILQNNAIWDMLGQAAAPHILLQSLSPTIGVKSSVQKAAKEWLFDRNVFRVIFDFMRVPTVTN